MCAGRVPAGKRLCWLRQAIATISETPGRQGWWTVGPLYWFGDKTRASTKENEPGDRGKAAGRRRTGAGAPPAPDRRKESRARTRAKHAVRHAGFRLPPPRASRPPASGNIPEGNASSADDFEGPGASRPSRSGTVALQGTTRTRGLGPRPDSGRSASEVPRPASGLSLREISHQLPSPRALDGATSRSRRDPRGRVPRA